MYVVSYIVDININVCFIIRFFFGNWLICYVDYVNIWKLFMYVIEVDFIDVIVLLKECLKKSVKRFCMFL